METFHLKIGFGKQNSVGNPKANNEVFFGTRARGFTGAVVFRIAGNNGSADFLELSPQITKCESETLLGSM